MSKRILLMVIGIAMAAGLWTVHLTHSPTPQPVFGKTLLHSGSTGKDVRELQGRLHYLGYYPGKIDGVFGPVTRSGLMKFEHAFGMKADGVAGPKVKLELWRATKNWAPGSSLAGGSSTAASVSAPKYLSASNRLNYSSNDIRLMSNAVYGEARGEPFEGEVAVAAVILNRVKSPNFPNSVASVIYQPGAFTAVQDGQINLTPNARATQAVMDAIHGWDPTGGCIYYFNPNTATSSWIWSRPQAMTIGKHIFCH